MVQKSGDFQGKKCQLCKGPNNVQVEKILFERENMYHDDVHLHPLTTDPSYTLQFPRHTPDKILKVKVTTATSKVKSRSHHDIAHIHPLTNGSTKYQLPIPYGF